MSDLDILMTRVTPWEGLYRFEGQALTYGVLQSIENTSSGFNAWTMVISFAGKTTTLQPGERTYVFEGTALAPTSKFIVELFPTNAWTNPAMMPNWFYLQAWYTKA